MPRTLWRIYGVAWLLTLLMLLADGVWASRTSFRVERSSAMQGIGITCCMIVLNGLLWRVSEIRFRNVDRTSFYRNVAQLFMWITVLVAFTHVCVVFQYLCVATHFPLVTHALLAVDSALGFHWLDAYRWVEAHHWIRLALALAYASGNFQLFAIPVILAFTLNSQDYAEFVMQFLISATLAILIAVPLPTESAFLHFNIVDPGTTSTVTDYFLLRDGHARALSFSTAQGLISFPSLHAMLALCFSYALRHVRFVFPCAIALNALMILSTLTQGGHYLSDVLSGLVIGAWVIYFVRGFFPRPSSLPGEAPLIFTAR